MTPAPSARHPWLDHVRLAAVLLVLTSHAHPCPAEQSGWLAAVTGTLHHGGWVGVDLFFVLSGFLVSGLLFREQSKTGSIRVGRFLLRRGFKIYPAFWVMIAGTLAWRLVRGWSFEPSHIATEMLFIQCYFYDHTLWPHTWSLAVEEHFYLLLAALVAWLCRPRSGSSPQRPFRHIPLCFALVWVGCFSARWWLAATQPFTFQTHMAPTHLRLDSLFLGVLLSWAVHVGSLAGWRPSGWQRPALLGLGSALLIPAFIYDFQTDRWIIIAGLPIFSLGAAAIILAGHQLSISIGPVQRLLAFTGAQSYSIYLWHTFFIVWIVPRLMTHLPASWSLRYSLEICGSLAFGIVMAKLVEVPVLRLRDRWVPSLV